MTRMELLKRLRYHDWYHSYSDDHRVWQKGSRDADELGAELKSHGCPFKWWDIHKAICGYAVEKYVKVGENLYRNPQWTSSCIASQRREDLLTQEEINAILAWFAG